MENYPLEKITSSLWIKPAKITRVINLYAKAKEPIIILNADTITPTELTLITNLALITGNIGQGGIIALHATGNAQGLIDMGMTSDYLPGHQPIAEPATRQRLEIAWGQPLPLTTGKNSDEIIQGIKTGDIRGILVLGSEANRRNQLFDTPAFSVLVDSVVPQPPYPDVVLPGATFAESEGSYTNAERRIQRLNRAFPPPAGKENWEIISALSTALGYPMDYKTASAIDDEITQLVPIFKPGTQWAFLDNGKFNLKDGLARLRL